MNAPVGRYRGARVGILTGGLSAEREIARRSADAVAGALGRRGYQAVLIEADRKLAGRLGDAGVEVAFNALHGRYGEDGCVQGLLEVLAIPYTGSGVQASSLAMDKWLSKRVLQAAGLPTPGAELLGPAARPTRGLPLVVKPRSEGSSNGVAIIRAAAETDAALAVARAFPGDILAEDFIAGREVTVAIFDDRALAAMEVIALGDDFHSWEVKYTAGREEFILPAPLGERYDEVLEIALQAHQAMAASGYSRVDLRIDATGKAFVLECNTLPGLHALGWFPLMAKHVGIEFDDLIEGILDRASLGVVETMREEGL
ncbi:MAG: D-alanine--D-alanine ligase [Deltaproteobacteria bacterium]